MYACVCAGNTSKKINLRPTWPVCTTISHLAHNCDVPN